ncbi:MAG: 16S rRNA (adenine(1518)-N(6)/adenine(1519)-N(6))-dimethyltransferase RsmA [Acidobacteriota bacterium]
MPRKPKLGQNFLIDENAIQRIAHSLGNTSQRTVVEIGPGHGAITDLIAPRCARLHCIEFDPALARELTFRFRNAPHVTIHHADILAFDLASLLPTPYSLLPVVDVIGNLPYYITSDILLHLFRYARQGLLARAVLMMQREVADRIAAPPGVSDYGPLSAFTQLHATVTNLFTLPPGAFNPPPDVYSTVLRLDFAPRFTELQVDPDKFNTFLRASFMQKRKTLSNNLRNAGYTADQLSSAWPSTIPPQARSEAVPLEAMAHLFRNLTSSGPTSTHKEPSS